MKRLFIGILVVGALAGGYYAYTRYQQEKAAAQTSYQTVKVTRGELVAMVGATGTVRANQTAVISWQTSGIVGNIYVKQGDTIPEGQILTNLNRASLSQSLILAQADLVAAQKSLDELNRSNLAQAQAQLALNEAQTAYDKAKNKREAMKYPRGTKTNVDNAYSQYELAQSNLALAQRAYDRVAFLDVSDIRRVQALNDLTTAQKARDTALGTYNWLTGKPTDADIAQADANLAVAQAQLEDAQREWDRLKDGPDPNDIAAAQARIEAAQATINMAHLTAPFAGTITDITILRGDLVSPGTPAFRLDDLSHLLVDVEVSEIDINRVAVGQKVNMTFDAISGKEYAGTVKQVARYGTPSQGVVNFIVTVEVTNPDNDVRTGMTAAVNIIVNRLENVLLVPNRAIRLRQGQYTVYVLRNGLPAAETLKLGASSDTMSEILSSNLVEGEEIILNPPLDFQSNGGSPFGMGG
ncbi:MAG: efflux RND transporter periplasmic adaptor subunit [Chloroflexi bacterium]|nr:efflux RND transporter periplasmic adaptor subunit [Chloroflexota bacterium]